MKEYLKAQIKTNATILNNAYSLDEIKEAAKKMESLEIENYQLKKELEKFKNNIGNNK